MKISHTAGNTYTTEGDGAFILPGDGYFSLGGNSQYQGWVVDTYKILANIYREEEPRELINEYKKVTRRYDDGDETFYLTDDVLHYEPCGDATIELDCRPIHDFHDQGRIYRIEQRKGDVTLVHYTKYATDELERVTHEHYIAVKGAQLHPQDWMERQYSYDERRHAQSTFYTYKARLEPMQETVTFAAATSPEDAIAKANRKHGETVTTPTHDDLTAGTALHGLKSLEHGEELYAGLPWFFQHWYRDHLVSLSGYRAATEYWRVKDVLLHILSDVHQDGWTRNHTSDGDLRSADATGWLFYQLHELCTDVPLYDVFSTEELERIADLLDIITEGITGQHYRNGLVDNGPLETWMDTGKAGRGRSGCRVEIQALYARMFRFGRFLQDHVSVDQDYERLEENLRANTRHYLLDDVLHDGYDGELDRTTRPNVFLAFHVYPDLLSQDDWEATFDHALDKLWLDWGGLASIDQDHDLFCPEYQGQTNESYHFGDSWYFVNNISALAMHRLNAEKYNDIVERIYQASVDEMFGSGYAGRCAEVSSASERRSEGCRLQAWSHATLLELHSELV